MNKKIIFMIIIFITIASGIFYWLIQSIPEELKDENDHTFIFVCPSDNEFKISYDEKDDPASLFMEGKEYKLRRFISASGARYGNDDETVVFWEHQGEAMVEIDGEIIYKECKIKE